MGEARMIPQVISVYYSAVGTHKRMKWVKAALISVRIKADLDNASSAEKIQGA